MGNLFKKVTGLGDRSGEKLTTNTSGKSDKELAEEGSDPYAMLRYSSYLLHNEDKSLAKARNMCEKAFELYPDNLDVRYAHANMMSMCAFVDCEVGTYDRAYTFVKKYLADIEYLRSKRYNKAELKKTEDDGYMTVGKVAFYNKDTNLALQYLAKADSAKYPSAIYFLFTIHMCDCGRYSKELLKETKFLQKSLNEHKWEESELAGIYFGLSVIYANGIPGLRPDVKYAYACINKCAEISPNLAQKEMGRYSKGLFGKIKYN